MAVNEFLITMLLSAVMDLSAEGNLIGCFKAKGGHGQCYFKLLRSQTDVPFTFLSNS